MAKNGDRLFPLGPAMRVRQKLRLRPSRDTTIELREFGGWTLKKLSVLDYYLKQYRRVAGGGTYIDGFAGQGSLAIRGVAVATEQPVLVAWTRP